MNCSPFRLFTLLLLLIAVITTLYEVTKKYSLGKDQSSVTLNTATVRREWESQRTRHQVPGKAGTSSSRPQNRRRSAADVLLEEVASNGPQANEKGGHLSLMMTTVDSAAAEALLPVFLEALHKTVPPAYKRLVVMSTDASALSACRKIHSYCLPWFDRRQGESGSVGADKWKALLRGAMDSSRGAEAPASPHLPPQWARVAMLQQLLGKRYDVIMSDVDVVWLKNPFTSLASGNSNFKVTVDREVTEDGSQKPCTGVMHIRASEPSRALVKTWLGLARTESGGPSSLFSRAWSLTQSSYPGALQVSYLDTREYPNGCSYLKAAKQGDWKRDKESMESIGEWAMWHAACLEGLQQKGKSMKELMELYSRARS